MKDRNIKIIKHSLIVIVVFYFIYILVSGEIEHYKNVQTFCKQECNYNSNIKKWKIDLKWFFDEEGVESRMDTEKYFSEKDFDQCINYCRDLEEEFKYLTQ